jgi:hypothetical protein
MAAPEAGPVVFEPLDEATDWWLARADYDDGPGDDSSSE